MEPILPTHEATSRTSPTSAQSVVFGVLVWASLLLRDQRLRALLPLGRAPRLTGS